ncbi:hypothetical protein [Devosia soli]|uniref:hypothetical protein n=1 Tax=Devosia soli TaxID=361041 RepID=UPI000A87F5DA|nr:hypothetical protein [Devosia soli]
MCEQCQPFDEEEDALAASFLARQQKAAIKPASTAHALIYTRAPAAPPRKEKPSA